MRITVPSAESGVDFTAWRHYRYWKGSFHTDTNPGHPNLLRYVYDSEGLRRFDWSDDSTLNESWDTATNTALRPYAASHFEYDSSRRVRATWSGGACGCGGGADGTHHLTYEDNGLFTDNPNAYDVGWHKRVMVERPDGTFLTQYFDETIAFVEMTYILCLSTPEGWLIVATGEAASGSAATSR